MNKKLVLLGTTLLLLCCVTGVRCWGAEGHAIVADIAQSLLTTHATKAIVTYLGGDLMDQVSSVPDAYDHTTDGKWSSPLHYVNMNRGQTEFEFSVDCNKAPGCVVSAIQNYTKILKNQVLRGSNDDEPNALIFLIHFVGDSHQPLHVGYLDDIGGNDVQCSFFGDDTELHAVWDAGMIQRYNSDESTFAKELIKAINTNQTVIDFYNKTMDPVDWANESFSLVRGSVYVGVYGNYPKLGDTYYNNNMPIVKDRLTAAGIRLGSLINSIFDP